MAILLNLLLNLSYSLGAIRHFKLKGNIRLSSLPVTNKALINSVLPVDQTRLCGHVIFLVCQ